MRTEETQVLVVGGGATGAGVARDAAMRGLGVILVERGDLATGTTGRFHGLLHSGGRYVVKDPVSARECIEENAVLRRIAPDCIEDTGGLFVATPWDDPGFGEEFAAGCREAGIPVQEVPVAEVLRREPRLHPGLRRAYAVPDAAIDSWKAVSATTRSARQHGARVLTYHPVVDLVQRDGTVVGARLRDLHADEDVEVRAEIVINASGAWAGQIAAMAGCEVHVLCGRGIMIAMNHRLVQSVVNRLKLPGDGDILVPIRTVSVIGTTDEHVADPDDLEIRPEEVAAQLEEGDRMVPGLRDGRALRVWAGVRPLYQEHKAGESEAADTRDVTRKYALLDHLERDGVAGLITVTGGKFTTYRLMAETTVDAACRHLGVTQRCRTAEEVLPGSEGGDYYVLGARLAARERALHDDQAVCECELVSRRALVEAIERLETRSLDDLRRTLRIGMGPCQGGFCIYRTTGVMHGVERLSGPEANGALLDFLEERWRGVQPLLHGDNLRQARLDEWIFQGLLDVPHLPLPA